MKYIYKTICPKIKEESSFFECLNAIGILENCKWKTMFDSYIDVLHKYGNGPSEDEKNKKCLLKEMGYSFHDPKDYKGYALLKRGSHYYAFIHGILYGIINPEYLDPFEEYEMYIKDFHYDYQYNILKHENTSTSTFQYSNPNPNGNLSEDCSIRAISHSLNINWHEALDQIAIVAYKMNRIHLNHIEVIEKVLEINHFIKHKPLANVLNVYQFSKKIKDLQGPVLLYTGKNHITCLKKINGEYKIYDAWDCSRERAYAYFTLEKEEMEKGYLDRIVIHPVYKEGIIYKQEGNKVYVSFEDQDRILGLSWILEHCDIIK